MNYFRTLRDGAICVVLLVLPFVVLNSSLKDPSNANALDRTVLELSGGVQWLASQAAYSFSGVFSDYVHLVDVHQESDRLRMDNSRLREEVRTLRVQADENRRLRDLLALRNRIQSETVTAEIIAKEFSRHFRVVRVRLDRGTRDRIQAHMPVVAADGLVGEVRNAAGHYADITLTVDRNSAVDIVIPRTGARGILRGTGDDARYLCQIEYLLRTDDVRVGDEIYTSGLGQRFPASILVGRVSKVTRRTFGLYQQAEVVPSVNFSELGEVLVLTSTVRPEGTGTTESGAE
jgi:rod shape-determining protein MreC